MSSAEAVASSSLWIYLASRYFSIREYACWILECMDIICIPTHIYGLRAVRSLLQVDYTRFLPPPWPSKSCCMPYTARPTRLFSKRSSRMSYRDHEGQNSMTAKDGNSPLCQVHRHPFDTSPSPSAKLLAITWFASWAEPRENGNLPSAKSRRVISFLHRLFCKSGPNFYISNTAIHALRAPNPPARNCRPDASARSLDNFRTAGRSVISALGCITT